MTEVQKGTKRYGGTNKAPVTKEDDEGAKKHRSGIICGRKEEARVKVVSVEKKGWWATATYVSANTILVLDAFSIVNFVFPSCPAIRPIICY